MNRDGYLEQATLSVIVPCYNEQATLAVCIQSLLEIQDADLSLEIIIVDDGSSDDSITVAQDLSAEHIEVRLVRLAP